MSEQARLKGVVDAGAAFPAGAQPAVLVQPGQGGFDRPVLPANPDAGRECRGGR